MEYTGVSGLSSQAENLNKRLQTRKKISYGAISADDLNMRYSHINIFIVMNYLGIVNEQNVFYLFQLLYLLYLNINIKCY